MLVLMGGVWVVVVAAMFAKQYSSVLASMGKMGCEGFKYISTLGR